MADRTPLFLYQQVKDYISAPIPSGVWVPHSRIPSENELVKTLSVSRMAINRALRELTVKRHLVRLQGIGTFVAARKTLSFRTGAHN